MIIKSISVVELLWNPVNDDWDWRKQYKYCFFFTKAVYCFHSQTILRKLRLIHLIAIIRFTPRPYLM